MKRVKQGANGLKCFLHIIIQYGTLKTVSRFKKGEGTRHQWLRPVILATQEADIRSLL
jgi:hypothetical protein